MVERDANVGRRIGDRIRLQRRALGLTQSKLAAAIEKSQNSISDFETGVAMPAGETLRRLSIVLQMPADWILNGAPGVPGEMQDLLVRLIDAFGDDGPGLLANATDEELARFVRLFRAVVDEK